MEKSIPKGKRDPRAVIKRQRVLEAERMTWDATLRDIGIYMNPGQSDISTVYSPGTQRSIEVLDNTAMNATELLAGFMHGELTSPDTQFFQLTTGNAELDLVDIVRQTMEDIGLAIYTTIENSNFHTEIHPYWLGLVSQGTSCITVEEDEEDIVRFSARHLKGLFFSENNKGIIDEVYDVFEWDIRQIVAEWGEKVLQKHHCLLEAWEKNSDQRFRIINAVYPREPGAKPGPRRYISQYVLCVEEGVELAVEYFREHPFIISRWVKWSGESMGRGPGWKALPDAKVLNKMTEDTLVAAQKVMDPPLQVPDDTFVLPIRTRPGGLNYYRAGTQDRIEPLFNGAQIDFGFQALEERRSRIRDAFYVNELRLDVRGPQMTATEVNARRQQGMRLLGPMTGRQRKEFLRPLIERVFEILVRRGKIVIPEDVINQLEAYGVTKFDVTYSSPIAQVQKKEQGNAIQRTFQAIAPLMALDPRVADNFNPDRAARLIAKNEGCPQIALNSEEEVEQKRAAIAAAQQQQLEQVQQQANVEQAAQILPAAAKMAQVEQQSF